MAFTRDDVVKDTPTNTFATLNPLASIMTLTQGNLQVYHNATWYTTPATMYVNSGKWYWENCLLTDGQWLITGIRNIKQGAGSTYSHVGAGAGYYEYGYVFDPTDTRGDITFNNNTSYTGGSTTAGVGTVIGIFLDFDNSRIKFYKDGVMQYDLLLYQETFAPAASPNGSNVIFNFGQDPTFANNKVLTKVYTDASGYGRFFYEPPAGAMALCTANLDTANLQPAEYIVDETNQHMLTYNGNAQISKFSPYTTDGWSINFDGSSELLYTNTNIYNLNFLDWMDQNNVETDKIGTIEAWIYLQDFSTGTSGSGQYTDRCILGRGGTFLNFGVRRDGKLRLYMYNSKNQYWTETDNAVITLRRWHHVAVSTYYDSNAGFAKVRMFIDGIEKNSTSYDDGVSEGNNRFWGSDFTNTTSGYENIYIGREGSEPATSRWIGYIKDLRVTKDSLYTTNFSVPTSNLQKLTNTVLLIGNSTSFNDASDNAFIFSPVGQPSISDWSPYQRSNDFDTAFFRAKDNYYGGSFYFDGSGDYLSNNDVEFYLDENDNGSSSTPSNFSFNFWTYLTDLSAQYRVFFSRYGVSWSYQLFWDQTNKRFWFNINSSGSTTNLNLYFSHPTGLNVNQWHHISFRREGTGTTSSTYRLYLDGIQIGGDQTDNGKINRNGSSSPFRIGTTAGGTGSLLYEVKGYITDFQLKKGAQGVYLPFNESTTPPSTKISSDANTKLLLQPWHTKTSAGVMSLIDSYAQDETGKSLTYYNGATIVDSSPYKGSNFGSFSLDGVSQYVFTPDHTDFNLSSNDFTIEQWVKLRDLTESTLLNQSIGGATSDSAFIFYINGSASLIFYLTPGTGWDKNTSGYTMSANVWYHVAAVRNGNSLDLYVNGNKVGTTTDVTGYVVGNSTRRLQIGAQESSYYLNGIVTDARIVNGQALYTTDFISPAYPLSATHYTTDGTDPATSSTKQSITGTLALLTQPGKVTKRNNVAAQDPDAYMKAVKYIGDGANLPNGQSITTVGFQPDLVWIKYRNAPEANMLFDSVRGVGFPLSTNTTGGDSGWQSHVNAGNYFFLHEFNSTGFKVNRNAGTSTNESGGSFVAWCFRAGGAPTTDNTATSGAMTASSVSVDGALQSSYTPAGSPTIYPKRMSVNTKAGFSIISYTGISASNVQDTIPHGLNSIPEFIIIKDLSNATNWRVYHKKITTNETLYLNTTGADTAAADIIYSPNSSTITLGNGTSDGGGVARNSTDHICYAWHSVAGYSAFGSYTGNGSTTGTEPFVYTGFKPAWLIIKRSDLTNDGWYIYDTARSPYNVVTGGIRANSANAEDGTQPCDFLSNGFRIRIGANGNFNATNGTYIYAAFAEQPVKYNNAR